jgi:hypothetical protein
MVWFGSGSFGTVARSEFVRMDQKRPQSIPAVLKMAKTNEKRDAIIIKEVRT